MPRSDDPVRRVTRPVTASAHGRTVWFMGLAVLSWCVMTIVHEAGHIVCGWASGGTLQHAELRPWRLPHSHFDPNPHPLVTLWGGPILGVVAPLIVASIIRRDATRFIAAFCLLANGLYLATAWFSGEPFLDTPQLLRHGAHPLSIAAYCLGTIIPGYLGLRRHVLEFFNNRIEAK